jgi:hypothetical protein
MTGEIGIPSSKGFWSHGTGVVKSGACAAVAADSCVRNELSSRTVSTLFAFRHTFRDFLTRLLILRLRIPWRRTSSKSTAPALGTHHLMISRSPGSRYTALLDYLDPGH